jgi:hypothetical protein
MPQSNAYTCDLTAASAARTCTSSHLATGKCILDGQGMNDGCPRVIEDRSNGVCAGPVAIIPGPAANINAWYRGPFSRCLEQNESFGRNGFRYTDANGMADCYRMACVDSLLHVVIDDVHIPCPEGQLVSLDRYPGMHSLQRCQRFACVFPPSYGDSWIHEHALNARPLQQQTCCRLSQLACAGVTPQLEVSLAWPEPIRHALTKGALTEGSHLLCLRLFLQR